MSPFFYVVSLVCLASLFGGAALCVHRLVIGPSPRTVPWRSTRSPWSSSV